MSECYKCGQNRRGVGGCDEYRTIAFLNDGVMKPIPYGESNLEKTYQEMVESYERDIATGGRGKLEPKDIRKQLEAFEERWDEEEYNDRRCHDCRAKMGEVHHPLCIREECPKCGGQYFICNCWTDEKKAILGEEKKEEVLGEKTDS